MRGIICLFLLLASFGCGKECNRLPLVSYDFRLTNLEDESFYCWTQNFTLDLTTDETFAASFYDTCTITLIRMCDTTSHMDVVCLGVNLHCDFNGTEGYCENDLDEATCKYAASLVRN